MACKECEAEMAYYMGEVEEISGINEGDLMELLGLTSGYLVASKLDSYLLDWAKKQTAGSFGANFKGVYYRNGSIWAAGLAAVYFSEDMKFVKDAGKGAIVYSIKELIAYAMPTMGISGNNISIGNPDTMVKNIGNPDTMVKNIGNPNNLVEIGEKIPKNIAIAENAELMKNVFNQIGKDQPREEANVRVMENTSKNDSSNFVVKY